MIKIKNIGVVFVVMLFCALAGNAGTVVYSQEEITTAQETSPSLSSEPQAPEEVPETKEFIKEIVVVGNKLINVSTILSKIKTRINQQYFERVARDDIKRLYDTGFFSDVAMAPETVEGGLKVVITVTEKPLVDTVAIEGMRILRKDLIQEKFIKTKSGQYLDYNRLREDVQEIKQQYQKKGYSQVEVNYSIDVDKETHKAKVAFVVAENMRIRIRRVYIQGNEQVKKNKIIRAMKTRQARLFHAGYFKEGEFQDDLERIRILYITEGFPEVSIDSKTEYDEKGMMYVYIYIKEGKQYTIEAVRITGNKVFSNEALTEILKKTKPGNVYSELAMQEDMFNLRSFYLGKGYLFATIKESASTDSSTGNVNVVYAIEENEIAYVDKINIVGNTKTKDKVIRREIRLKPGERFDGDKLKRSKERLENLQYFEEVVFDTESGSESNKEDLVVEVKETQTGSFSFGGGYSTVDQLIGFVEVEQRNFDIFNFPYFTGAGQDLTFRWEIGSIRQNFSLSFTEPWLFDHPLSFGFDLYKSEHDKELDVGYPYNEERTGGAIRLGKALSEYLKANMTYRLEEVDISEIDESASSDLKNEEGNNVLSSLEFGLTHDTRDSEVNPKKGRVLSTSAGVTGGPLGGDKDFIRLFDTFSQYFSFGEKSVIEAKLRAGALLTFEDTHDIPIFERFYAGGTYSIRGYNERKVGPIDPVSEDPIGGESIALFNLEYTFALNDFLKLATFFDSGNVWRKVEDFGSGDFKSGVGIGVRVKTPIGPVKLDYGFPLNTEPGEEDKSGKFHFSMSRAF